MALPRGGRPGSNTTPCTPRRSNSKGGHRQTGLSSGTVNPHPIYAKCGAPPITYHTRPKAYASTKGTQGHFQGWPIPSYCSSNLLLRLHSCTSASPRVIHSHCPLYLILFVHSKIFRATPGSWSQIPQLTNIGTCVVGTPSVVKRHRGILNFFQLCNHPKLAQIWDAFFSNEMGILCQGLGVRKKGRVQLVSVTVNFHGILFDNIPHDQHKEIT